jgi:signal transduction histidine kinase
MWIGVQIAVYAGLVLGYASLLVLEIRHRIEHGRQQRLQEAMLLLAALWTLVLALLTASTSGVWWAFAWDRVAQIGLVLLALLASDFSDAFVERRGRRWLRWTVVGVLLVAAVVLDVRPFPWPLENLTIGSVRLGSIELATLFLIGAWVVATGSALWISASALRKARGSKHRNRIRYLQVSLIGIVVGDLFVLVGGIPAVYVGFALRLLGSAMVAFATLRYDLPDLRRLSLVVLRVAILAALTAALYLLFLLAAGLVWGSFAEVPPLAVVAPAIILAVLVAAVVDVALGPRLHRFFDRTVLGQSYGVQRALRDYSRQINLILDLDRLADTTLDWLQTTLRVERPAFLLFTALSGGQIELKVLRATTSPLPPPQTFSADSRFIAHFRNIGQPLSQYDLDMLSWFQVMEVKERQWLKELAADLYVPVLVAGKPVALLALGPKADGQPYSAENLETLTTLAGQTGTAVENARLVDNLRSVQADIQRLNNELAETNRQLQRLDQVKADFVAIASHELRTPLSQIFGYSDVLASMEGDELGDAQVVDQFIGGIARGARRLKRVVDAMVDVSLIETGTLKMQLAPLSLSEIVESVVQRVGTTAEERDLSIAVSNLSELPQVMVDRARLEQVFLSLVSNAVKFTPDGGEISISGRLVAGSSGEGDVEVMVSDRGIGIDPDQTALIFEKFYRPENPLLHSTNEVGFKGAGPGLGLAIAKGIVEAHGGRIWVESPGRDEKTFPGSIFHVRLPVAGPAEEQLYAQALP